MFIVNYTDQLLVLEILIIITLLNNHVTQTTGNDSGETGSIPAIYAGTSILGNSPLLSYTFTTIIGEVVIEDISYNVRVVLVVVLQLGMKNLN